MGHVHWRIWAALAALLFVGALAFVVTADNPVTRADLEIVEAIAGDRTSAVGVAARAASWFGNIVVLGSLAALAAWLLRSRGAGWPQALLPAGALLLAAVLDPLAKLAVGRPRPPLELAEVIESASGYPSGHSAQSAAFWLAAAFAVAATPRGRRRAVVLGAVIAACVGFSRVVLGVHSPTDLLGGWALGAACALLAIECAERAARRDVRQRQPAADRSPPAAQPPP